MKVIITASEYHDRYGVDHERGDEVEFNAVLAAKLVRLGIAQPAPVAKPKPVVETAEKAPPENAAKHTTKPTPRKGAK